jgi:predicted nucleic acid-binding protein
VSVLFDASVLVAGLVEAHPHHAVAFPWIRRVHAGQLPGAVAAHSLAETYSVLTTLPHQPRITPAASLRLIRVSLRRFQVVSLGARDYLIVVRTLADAGLAGGIIYDALAARAAAKTGAERILTLNRRDFDRLQAIFGVRVASP